MAALKWDHMQLLITGANGFLGREIVRQIMASGMHFHATDKQAKSVLQDMDYWPAAQQLCDARFGQQLDWFWLVLTL